MSIKNLSLLFLLLISITSSGCTEITNNLPFLTSSNVDVDNEGEENNEAGESNEAGDSSHLKKILLENYKVKINKEPDNSAHHFNRCQVYKAIDYKRAIEECTYALKVFPNFKNPFPEPDEFLKYDITRTLCEITVMKGDYEKSIKYCQDARKILDDFPADAFQKDMAIIYVEGLIEGSKNKSNENLLFDETICQKDPNDQLCQDIRNGNL